MSTFTKVIVGDDGLAGGADALALARTLAPTAELILASTYPWDPAPSRATQPGYAAILREDTLAKLAERVRAAGLPETVRTVAVADSSPGRGLHRLAESEGAGLIVIGSAHHGPVGASCSATSAAPSCTARRARSRSRPAPTPRPTRRGRSASPSTTAPSPSSRSTSRSSWPRPSAAPRSRSARPSPPTCCPRPPASR